jgi:Arc/MetJ-type ribon-helix-helix transcriptional regulator
MQVDITPDQQALIRHAIAAGRINTADEAVREALSLWEERERGRAEFLARLDTARASIARGEGMPITQGSMRELAEDVKQRGRERLVAERSAPV